MEFSCPDILYSKTVCEHFAEEIYKTMPISLTNFQKKLFVVMADFAEKLLGKSFLHKLANFRLLFAISFLIMPFYMGY